MPPDLEDKKLVVLDYFRQHHVGLFAPGAEPSAELTEDQIDRWYQFIITKKEQHG